MENDRDHADAKVSAARLLEMIAGGWLAQAVFVAAKLGVADHLSDGAKTIDELAKVTGVHPPSLDRVLRLLASRGIFFLRSDGSYEQTELSKGLRSDATVSLRNFAIMVGEEPQRQAWGNLLHSVMTGQSAFAAVHGCGLYDYLSAHPDAAAVFDAAITERARQENSAVRAAYRWPNGTIVDIGGGQGSLLAEILEHAPGARGILFEMPHVAEGAKKLLDGRGLSSRCEVIAGNALSSLPSGKDLYVMRRVLHGMSDERALTVLQRCRAAMKPGSRLLVIEHVLAADNHPSWGQMLDVQMLVLNAGGKERTRDEFESLLRSARLAVSQVISTEAVTAIVEARAL